MLPLLKPELVHQLHVRGEGLWRGCVSRLFHGFIHRRHKHFCRRSRCYRLSQQEEAREKFCWKKQKKEQHLNRSTKRLLDNRNSCRVQTGVGGKKQCLCPEIAEWLKSATPGASCVPPLTLDQTLTKYSLFCLTLCFLESKEKSHH